MNDVPHDRITDGLRESAETIDVGDPDERLIDIRQRAKRRTNRRRGAVGALCAVALVGVGAVVVNDAADDGDIIRSADVADESTGEDADDRAVDPAPATTTTTTTVPSSDRAMVESADADTTVVDGLEFADGPRWLVAWRDGFLAGSARYEPPMLPAELPADVAALFPQEVLDLFVSDLPMPIDEAFERISMAGHDDVLEAAFTASPDVMEALYGPPGPPSVEFEFSTDGTDWAPIDVELPEGVVDISQLTTVGDRLVIVSQTFPVVPDDDSFSFPDVAVHATTDLTTWTSQVVPTSGRDDLPASVMNHRWPQQIAVQDGRWMVALEGSIDIDVASLVSDEVRDRMDREGWGYTPSPDGLTVELYDEENLVETIEFTYDELGISPELAVELSNGGHSVEIWTATWDGDPIRAADPFSATHPAPGGTVIALGSGFMASGSSAAFSIDGSSWEPMPGAPNDVWISSTLATDSGVVAFTDGPTGPQVYLIDAALTWAPIEIPGAPERFYPAFGNGRESGAVVVDAGIADVPEPEPVEVSIAAGDFVLIVTDGPSGQTYRVLDAAGTVVTSETWSYDDATEDIAETGPFEFLLYDETGITALSPQDGSVLFTIDHDAVSDAYNEAYGLDETTFEEPEMDPWLLATADGTNWLVEQLDANPMYWQIQTARNGSTVLVSAGTEWSTYELP